MSVLNVYPITDIDHGDWLVTGGLTFPASAAYAGNDVIESVHYPNSIFIDNVPPNAQLQLGVSAINIPGLVAPGAWVEFSAYLRQMDTWAAGSVTVHFSIRVGGIWYNSTPKFVADANPGAVYSHIWFTNPATGVDWTRADLNSVDACEIFVDLFQNHGGWLFTNDWQLSISYVDPAVPTTTGPVVWFISPNYNNGYPCLKNVPTYPYFDGSKWVAKPPIDPITGLPIIPLPGRPLPPGPLPPGPLPVITLPIIYTTPATEVTDTGAQLNGYLQSDAGVGCGTWFEWGSTTDYGNRTAQIDHQSYENTYTRISDLNSGVAYHFRAVAQNSYGISYGDDQTFVTIQLASEAGFVGDAVINLLLE